MDDNSDLTIAATPNGWDVHCPWTTLHIRRSVYDPDRWQMYPAGRDPYEWGDHPTVDDAFDAVRTGLRP